MDQLPEEILFLVLSYLPPFYIISSLRLVCLRFRSLIGLDQDDQKIWKALCQTKALSSLPQPKGGDFEAIPKWRDHYFHNTNTKIAIDLTPPLPTNNNNDNQNSNQSPVMEASNSVGIWLDSAFHWIATANQQDINPSSSSSSSPRERRSQ